MKGEKMGYKEFEKNYKKLSDIHQKIVYETLRRLEHDNKHKGIPEKGYDLKANINNKRKTLGITHEQIKKRIEEKYGVREIDSAYDSMLTRRSEKSAILPMVLDVLEMTDADAKKPPKDAFFIMCSDSATKEWLYNSLSMRDKKAIDFLVAALYMEEVAPEVFDDDDDYYD